MNKELGIACAWCGQLLGEEAMEGWVSAGGCHTCSYGNSADIEIKCTNLECPKYNKVIYKKEVE